MCFEQACLSFLIWWEIKIFSLQPKGAGAKTVAIGKSTIRVAPFLKVIKGAKFV